MNEYYIGFIETCARFGMSKQAADTLYKQSAVWGAGGELLSQAPNIPGLVIKGLNGAKHVVGATKTVAKASKGGKSVAQAVKNVRPTRLNLANAKGVAPAGAANVGIGRRLPPKVTPESLMAGTARPGAVPRRFQSARPSTADVAGMQSRLKANIQANRAAEYARRLQQVRRQAANNRIAELTGRTVPQRAINEMAAGKAPAQQSAAAKANAANNARMKKQAPTPQPQPQAPQPQAPVQQQAPQPQAPVQQQAAANGAGAAGGAADNAAGQAIDELAAGAEGVQPSPFGNFFAAHPWLTATGIAVPAYLAGNYRGSRQ